MLTTMPIGLVQQTNHMMGTSDGPMDYHFLTQVSQHLKYRSPVEYYIKAPIIHEIIPSFLMAC